MCSAHHGCLLPRFTAKQATPKLPEAFRCSTISWLSRLLLPIEGAGFLDNLAGGLCIGWKACLHMLTFLAYEKLSRSASQCLSESALPFLSASSDFKITFISYAKRSQGGWLVSMSQTGSAGFVARDLPLCKWSVVFVQLKICDRAKPACQYSSANVEIWEAL